jgi:hypothetical protein
VEFYSPRNELEALNSIVLLIDKLLSSCQHSHTNILQGLRQTIFDLISGFGDQNNLKGVLEKYHSCEKEEHLIEWGKSHGVKTQLKIACKVHLILYVFQVLSDLRTFFFSFLCTEIIFKMCNTDFFSP